MDQEKNAEGAVTIALTRDLVATKEKCNELVFATHLNSTAPIILILPDGQRQMYHSRKAVLFMIDYAYLYYMTEVPTADYFHQMQCLMEQAHREEELRLAMMTLLNKLKEYYG